MNFLKKRFSTTDPTKGRSFEDDLAAPRADTTFH